MIKNKVQLKGKTGSGLQDISYLWVEDSGREYVLQHIITSGWGNGDDWKIFTLERAKIDLPPTILELLGI